MRSVNIATLKAHLSDYIRAARSGETIRILDRRREVATLSGVSIAKGALVANRLVEQGLARWQGGKPDITAIRPRKGAASVAEAVVEDRG